jgi:alpha-glucosidase
VGGRRNVRNWDLDEVHDIHRRWRRILDQYPDRMAVGEVHPHGLHRLVRYYGNDDELHMPFNFHFLERPWQAEAFRAVVERWERLLPHHAWPDYTLSNHDRSRASTRYGLHRARAAAVMLLTLRGTPFIYYGEEIGMTDVAIPADRIVDVADRDGERTPMQWDASRNAGFTTGEPWLPVGADHDRVNVAVQRDDPASTLSFYRRLLQLRRGSLALRLGSYRSLPASRGVFAFERLADGDRVHVAINFSDGERTVRLPGRGGELLLSTDGRRELGGAPAGLRLSPDEGVIVRAAP